MKRRAAIIGAMLAAVTAVLLWSGLSPNPLASHALLLGAIGAVYVGFGLADGRSRNVVLEVVVASVFLTLAAVGLFFSPVLIGVGLLLHGVWDFLHHPRAITTRLPLWYPPFCAVFDWVLALLFFLVAYNQGSLVSLSAG